MNIIEGKHQQRNVVREILNSDQSDKLQKCIEEIVVGQGYDDKELTKHLRSKLIKLDMKPSTVDVIIKGRVVGTVEVATITTQSRRLYTCTIHK